MLNKITDETVLAIGDTLYVRKIRIWQRLSEKYFVLTAPLSFFIFFSPSWLQILRWYPLGCFLGPFSSLPQTKQWDLGITAYMLFVVSL
jgi:hypothetical protein